MDDLKTLPKPKLTACYSLMLEPETKMALAELRTFYGLDISGMIREAIKNLVADLKGRDLHGFRRR